MLRFAQPHIYTPMDGSLVLHISGVGRGVGSKVFDLSNKGNHGIIHGACWKSLPSGHLALSFDGVDDYVEMPYSPVINPSEFTVIAWVRQESFTGDYGSVVTSRSSLSYTGYIIYSSSDRKWEFWLGNGSGWCMLETIPVVLNIWYHLAGWFKDGEMRLYINGILQGKMYCSFVQNTECPLRIGAGATEGDPRYFFGGLIGEVRVYNRALSASEIRELYNKTKHLYGY